MRSITRRTINTFCKDLQKNVDWQFMGNEVWSFFAHKYVFCILQYPREVRGLFANCSFEIIETPHMKGIINRELTGEDVNMHF